MARNVLTNLNLNKNEMQNMVLQPLATDPAAAGCKKGQLYFNTVSNRIRRFDGTAWGDVGAGVASVTAKAGETVIHVDNTDPENPVLEFKIAAEQGTGVTVTEEADGAKVEVQDATTAQKGIVQLDSTPSSTVEDKAATPKGANVVLEKQSTAEAGYFATYVLKQGGVALSEKINIPKDYLIKAAKLSTASAYAVSTAYKALDIINDGGKSYIVTADITAAENTGIAAVQKAEQTAVYTAGDKFLVFCVNVKEGAEDKSYMVVPVKDLVDVYTAGDGISISDANVVSIDNTITPVTELKLMKTKLDKSGLVKEYEEAYLPEYAVATIAAGSTSATVSFASSTGRRVVSAYATDADGNEVVTDIKVTGATSGVSEVKFEIASAAASAIDCHVLTKAGEAS